MPKVANRQEPSIGHQAVSSDMDAAGARRPFADMISQEWGFSPEEADEAAADMIGFFYTLLIATEA